MQLFVKCRRTIFIVVPFLTVLLASGCTTTSQPTPGDLVTIKPGWVRLKKSATQSFRDPNVWAPLLTAAVLQINDLDHEISDQLREDTPVFGSTQDARDSSDELRDLNEAAYISTALLVPGPEGVAEWFKTKSKLLGSEWLATVAAGSFTNELQKHSNREKPSQKNEMGFPSYHVTTSSMMGQMANLNVECPLIGASEKRALNITFDGIAALTAWARVEAGEHYPSDVLTGWVLGIFWAISQGNLLIPINNS